MRVLITRPQPYAELLAKKINALEIETIIFPTINIVDYNDPQVQNLLSDLSIYHGLIFISPVAVDKFASRIKNIPDNILLYAVGESTAQVLYQYSWQNVIYPTSQFGSEALIELLDLETLSGKCFLICQGKGGNTLLANTLSLHGANVSSAILYQRQLPAVENLPDLELIDIIICTSQESLQNLSQLFGKAIFSKKLLISSEKLAIFAKKLGFSAELLLADNASDAAILNKLGKINR